MTYGQSAKDSRRLNFYYQMMFHRKKLLWSLFIDPFVSNIGFPKITDLFSLNESPNFYSVEPHLYTGFNREVPKFLPLYFY